MDTTDAPTVDRADPGEREDAARREASRVKNANDERQLVLRNKPVVTRAGWLPRGLWPELEEVAEAHDQAVARLEAVSAEAQEIGKRFEDEDRERVEAYKTGLTVPQMTDPAERERIVAESKSKVDAAVIARDEAAVAGVRAVQAHEAEWLADLRQREVEARRKCEEAARQVEEATAGLTGVARTRHWIERTAANGAGRHIPHDALPSPKPEPPVDLAAMFGTSGDVVVV